MGILIACRVVLDHQTRIKNLTTTCRCFLDVSEERESLKDEQSVMPEVPLSLNVTYLKSLSKTHPTALQYAYRRLN